MSSIFNSNDPFNKKPIISGQDHRGFNMTYNSVLNQPTPYKHFPEGMSLTNTTAGLVKQTDVGIADSLGFSNTGGDYHNITGLLQNPQRFQYDSPAGMVPVSVSEPMLTNTAIEAEGITYADGVRKNQTEVIVDNPAQDMANVLLLLDRANNYAQTDRKQAEQLTMIAMAYMKERMPENFNGFINMLNPVQQSPAQQSLGSQSPGSQSLGSQSPLSLSDISSAKSKLKKPKVVQRPSTPPSVKDDIISVKSKLSPTKTKYKPDLVEVEDVSASAVHDEYEKERLKKYQEDEENQTISSLSTISIELDKIYSGLPSEKYSSYVAVGAKNSLKQIYNLITDKEAWNFKPSLDDMKIFSEKFDALFPTPSKPSIIFTEYARIKYLINYVDFNKEIPDKAFIGNLSTIEPHVINAQYQNMARGQSLEGIDS